MKEIKIEAVSVCGLGIDWWGIYVNDQGFQAEGAEFLGGRPGAAAPALVLLHFVFFDAFGKDERQG